MSLNPRETNLVLKSFSPRAYDRVEAVGELVDLRAGTVVERTGEPATHAYFPLDSTLSMVVVDGEGRSAETAMIGCREATGIFTISTGAGPATNSVVTVRGSAFRAPVEPLKRLFSEDPEFRAAILASMQALMCQLSFNAACHRFHRLEPRYVRWLLETHDRVGGGDMFVTHERSAALLGVQRAGLTGAANDLARRKLIIKRRGVTSVADRAGLEAASCDCYGSVKREYHRLMDRPQLQVPAASGSLLTGIHW